MTISLNDRMKIYEAQETSRRFLPGNPVIARIDGRSFHNFTRGMNQPYDDRLRQCFRETTKYLVEETSACMGYTQSDEITLCWFTDSFDSSIWFDG